MDFELFSNIYASLCFEVLMGHSWSWSLLGDESKLSEEDLWISK